MQVRCTEAAVPAGMRYRSLGGCGRVVPRFCRRRFPLRMQGSSIEQCQPGAALISTCLVCCPGSTLGPFWRAMMSMPSWSRCDPHRARGNTLSTSWDVRVCISGLGKDLVISSLHQFREAFGLTHCRATTFENRDLTYVVFGNLRSRGRNSRLDVDVATCSACGWTVDRAHNDLGASRSEFDRTKLKSQVMQSWTTSETAQAPRPNLDPHLWM